jgi:hypothetical protein
MRLQCVFFKNSASPPLPAPVFLTRSRDVTCHSSQGLPLDEMKPRSCQDHSLARKCARILYYGNLNNTGQLLKYLSLLDARRRQYTMFFACTETMVKSPIPLHTAGVVPAFLTLSTLNTSMHYSRQTLSCTWMNYKNNFSLLGTKTFLSLPFHAPLEGWDWPTKTFPKQPQRGTSSCGQLGKLHMGIYQLNTSSGWTSPVLTTRPIRERRDGQKLGVRVFVDQLDPKDHV